jgi:hypothetical protein
MSKISQVYAKLYSGKEDDAFKILDEVKINNKSDITPYAISADIYLKNNDFVKAKNEYEVYQKLFPDNSIDKDAIKNISMAEELYKIALKKSTVDKETVLNGEASPGDSEQIIEKDIQEEEEEEPEIIKRDNVSYF